MAASKRAGWVRYGVAVLALGAATLARALLGPSLGHRAPTLIAILAVMLAGWFGGLGPGLLVTVVGAAIASYFFVAPASSFLVAEPADRVEIALFVAIGVAISLLNEAVHAARESAEARARELRQREEAHRRIVATATEGIWTVDTKGVITYANRSMAEMLAVPASSLVGRDAAELFHDEDRQLLRERLVAIMRGERAVFDLRLRRADGMPVWAHASCAPVPSGRGEVAGVLSMFTDLSARHRVEAELQRLLASEKRAREEAEAANRAKDDFLATVSHELRTPLNAMLGWLTMLRSGALEPNKNARARSRSSSATRARRRSSSRICSTSRA